MASPNDGDRSGRKCKYVFKPPSEGSCTYDVPNGLNTHGYCILHAGFPKDPVECRRLANLKAEEVDNRIRNKDYNLEGTKLRGINLSSRTLQFGNLNLNRAEIRGDALFIETKIPGNILLGGAVIDGRVDFSGAEIGGKVLFGAIDAEEVKKQSERHGREDTEIRKMNMKMKRELRKKRKELLESGKEVTLICGPTLVPPREIAGRMSFRDTLFLYPDAKLEAFRAGKTACGRIGDRGDEDYHYYHETKTLHQIASNTSGTSWLRRQVNRVARNVFGYGVCLKQLLFAWFILIMFFFVMNQLILFGEGMVDGADVLRAATLSLLMAGIPGAWNPDSNILLMISTFIEAIAGTVLWFALLTVMARKYLK